MPNLANLDYIDRVNRAIDFVTKNLDQPLRLDEVAQAAGFSPYHFHRVFHVLVGETLHDFVTRVRLERAVYLFAHRGHRSWTHAALAVGFSSSSAFSRSFRAHFGVSPRRFDIDAFRRSRRAGLIEVVPEAERLTPAGGYGARPLHRPIARSSGAACRIWAQGRGLADRQWLGYQWEDPTIVPLELCRYDVAVEIPAGVQINGHPSETWFAPMRVAEIEIAGSIELELDALGWLYSTWLPRSGYIPDHQPGFEAWVGLPFAHGESHFEVRLQLAVTGA